MPRIYHTVPCHGFRGHPFVMQLLVEDEGQALLPVFVEYAHQGCQERLRLLPTDGYKGEESYSLYTVRIPPEHLSAVRFSYRFCIEEAHTHIYTFPLKNKGAEIADKEDERFPAVLPLLSGEQPYLPADAPCMRFVTFPHELLRLCVHVRVRGAWQVYDAVLTELGVWECRLPRHVVASAGKRLLYFVEASGGVYATRLGDERDPLSLRLVDDAGPLLTELFPADGETVSENPPELRIGYEDASGVDLRASAIYLDGRKAGENAIWTANGMSFRPELPLGEGEHVLEISLRDTRGNRTYRRVAFWVQGEGNTDGTPTKKPISTVRAAGFFAGAFSAIKKLFSDKE